MAIKVRELLAMTPDNVLEKIGQDVCIDKPNQKLTGMIMYKVLLYTIAKTTRVSLRIMESIYASPLFKTMTGMPDQKTRHSSFADRLSKIKPVYFATIFEYLVNKYNAQLEKKDGKSIYRFDSTIIGLSAKLFTAGMNYSGLKNNLHLKITIGQRGIIPNIVRFFTNQSEASEDIALKKTICEAIIDQEDFVIFDRGISAGKTFIELSEKDITFVTRLKIDRKINVIESMKLPVDELNEQEVKLIILSDQKVQIWNNNKGKFFDIPFRLIKAKSLKSQEEIYFFTNNFFCSAYEITELYKRRWDIEVFFRFIKQELNFKHFLARNLNGLKSYLYMVLILAILLLIYKTSNNKPGYKIVKMEFIQELENEVLAELIKFCGGDPEIFWERFFPKDAC